MSDDTRLAFGHLSERAVAMAGPEARDRISLRDHIRSVEIGAFQAERGTQQRVCFNVVVEVALPQAPGDSDDVDRILSYDTITEAIDRGLAEERLNLLETLAERIAADILADPLAARVFIRIEKLDRGPGALGVEIVRDSVAGGGGGVEVEKAPHPLVVFLDHDAIGSDRIGALLDRLQQTELPLLLCVGPAGFDVPVAAHPAAQRRIDLLAIEQNGWVLAGRDKRCVVVATRTELIWAMNNNQISVWAPSKMVLDAAQPTQQDALDAPGLARWLADMFEARALVHISDSDGICIDEVLAGIGLPPDGSDDMTVCENASGRV